MEVEYYPGPLNHEYDERLGEKWVINVIKGLIENGNCYNIISYYDNYGLAVSWEYVERFRVLQEFEPTTNEE